MTGATSHGDAPFHADSAHKSAAISITRNMSTTNYYDILATKFTLDNTPLLLSAGVSFAVGYMQYVYAIRLMLREGMGPMPLWMHMFYLAHDSIWSFLFGNAASRYGNHWFFRANSTALFLWSTLEIYCIHRAITKEREENYSSILGPNPDFWSAVRYTASMQLGMFGIVVLLIILMGEGCFLQWGCLTNVAIALGPTHEYLRRGSRRGLSLGFCLVNIFGTIWTFSPFGFWVLAIPEVFDQPAFYAVGFILSVYSIWAFFVVASYPPKKADASNVTPIW